MFNSLIGNERAKQSIRRLIRTNRFPQSTIFSGNDGIGKKRFAIETARSLTCKDPTDFSPCEKCGPCLRAAKFILPTSGKKEDYLRVFFSEHPDVGIVIPNKQTIYIDAIRDLEREANFRPYEAEARFFIIDEAEKMTPQASNALLKTLEEPAETTHIFLITSHPASLLSTIRSRCQTFRFVPIEESLIESFLFEKKGYSSADSGLIARIARGSMGMALSLKLDNYKALRKNILEILRTLAEGEHFASLLRAAEEISAAKSKEEFDSFLAALQAVVYDVWKLSNDDGAEIINIDVKKELQVFANEIPGSMASNWIEEIEELRENLRFNLNRKIAADALLMNMASGV